MRDVPRPVYRPVLGVSLEQAHAARARGWLYVFECWQENQKADKPAPEPVGRDDVKESNGYVATKNYSG